MVGMTLEPKDIINKIHLGDTASILETFPDNCVDIVVTSPPYNKGGAKGGLVKEVDYSDSSDIKNEDEYQAEQIDVLNELYRILAPGGHIFYNHKVRWSEAEMIHPLKWIFASRFRNQIRQEIVWDRGIAGNLRGWRFWQVEERIYWMQKGIKKGDELLSKHAKMTSIWRIRPENKFFEHPAPFPVALPTRCIYSVADDQKGLTVLDPYCGTGTTLSVASVLQHNYIGIDCSPEYIKIAEERLKTPLDITPIVTEMSLHKVEKTYAERKKSKISM